MILIFLASLLFVPVTVSMEAEEHGVSTKSSGSNIQIIEKSHDLHSKGAHLEAHHAPLSALHLAAQMGNVLTIECLHKQGANLEARDRYDQTPLHFAVRAYHIPAAQCLVRLGANYEARDQFQATLLHMIANTSPHVESVPVIKWLHQLGLDLDARDSDGATPLHRAASKGFVKHLECLCTLGANPDAQDNQLNMPLHSAVMADQANSITMLHSFEVNLEARNKDGHTPLHKAIESYALNATSCLCKMGAKIEAVTPAGKTPLDLAVQSGNHLLLALVYSNGANIKRYEQKTGGKLSLGALTAKNVYECFTFMEKIEEMKKRRAQEQELNQQRVFFPLHFLLPPISHEWLAYCAHLLQQAALRNYTPLVEHLLPLYPEINKQDRLGDTLLHIIAVQGSPEVARILLTHSSLDYSITNNEHKTACDYVSNNKSSLIPEQMRAQKVAHEILRAIKIRIFLWLCKADVRNQDGQRIILPTDISRMIARMTKL